MRVIIATFLATTGCVSQFLGYKFKVYFLWLWVIIAIGAPYLQGDSKALTAMIMLALIGMLLVLTCLFDYYSKGACVREAVNLMELTYLRLSLKPRAHDLSELVLACYVVHCFSSLTSALEGVDLGFNGGWIIIIILLLATIVHNCYELSAMNGLMISGWIILVIWCFWDWSAGGAVGDTDRH